ncbi:MAG: nucleoside triphosphate pyrophosphohydrolase [Clostridia bacterium]|nr:nucleoside triphosphate pyrophosphohydrolase [Clostridia bacterium]
MRKDYNKLVRDRIPEIIQASGKKAIVRTADDEEYNSFLRQKLQEEVDEFIESGDPEELADILEVITALAETYDQSFDILQDAADNKRKARGGFKDRVILISVES